MGRALGPKHRMCRRAGEKLCELDRCPSTRRNYPPGIHGQKTRRKMTEYGTQLLEKQKAKAVYGILERQLRSYYERALGRRGDTSVHLAQMLEMRLDNVVYRMGLTKSRAAARQAIVHGHISVNGKRLTIPSYQTKADDTLAVVERSRSSTLFVDFPTREAAPSSIPAWLSVDRGIFGGRVVRSPETHDFQQQPFRMQSIVEFYSR